MTQSQPSADHKRLQVFVGRWRTLGQTIATDSAPAMSIVGTDSYEWLDGGFFLVHHVDVRMGDQAMRGIEIIGYDRATNSYPTRSFDSQGNAGSYTATVNDDIWTFARESERATVVFSNNGNAMSAEWERTDDGTNWMPCMK